MLVTAVTLKLHGDVAFAAVDVLAGVVAAVGLGDGLGGAHRLGVHDGRGRLAVAAFGVADLVAQAVV
jgi:hypothetical protein